MNFRSSTIGAFNQNTIRLVILLLAFISCKESPKNVLDHKTETANSMKPISKDVNEMFKPKKVLIEVEELVKIKDKQHLILVDARYGKTAKEDFRKGHLEHALYVDLNTDLSDIKEHAAEGGRHPLPSLEKFSKTLTKLGITPESHVIIYDANNGALAAARFWWMLTAIGHQKVQVLNGGFSAATKAGYPVSTEIIPPKTAAAYQILEWKAPMVLMDEVEAMAKNADYKVIDVRARERYLGNTEPIDLVAGHIPGAMNVPFSGNLDKQGRFLSSERLQAKYQEILGATPIENTAVHCGSGVTACHTLLAFAHAGFALPNLYVGSWSEWSRNNKPIATSN